MPTFAHKLREYFSADGSKKYYLTAAPQCVYPDAADGPMLDGTVWFDAIWVQFYNNHCGLQNFNPGASFQTTFNFDRWDAWAHQTSKNPDVRVYIGVPASPNAAGSGYQSVSDLTPIIDYAATFSSFGGVMMWDASQAYSNSGFISGVASALANEPPATRVFPTIPPTVTPVGKWGQVSLWMRYLLGGYLTSMAVRRQGLPRTNSLPALADVREIKRILVVVSVVVSVRCSYHSWDEYLAAGAERVWSAQSLE